MANTLSHIPEGMHTITPHLIVNGASEYLDFLKGAFGPWKAAGLPDPSEK
jgi:PhnB protein